MKAVSEQYREAIQMHRENAVRNPMHVQVYFGVIDQYAAEDATVTTSPALPYATTSGLITGENNITESYASWEQNYFQLNGTQYFLPTSNFKDQGFISSELSGADGTFSVNPYIDVVFSQPHSMVGLTIQFDTVTQTYPSEFRIDVYEEGTLKKTETVSENTSVVYTGELDITDADHIRITFLKTSPYNRIRVDSLVYGIAYVFGDQDLMKVEHKRSINPVSLELPSESLTFTLFNQDDRYNIASQSSLVRFLQQEQTVVIRYGYEIDSNGTIEWLDGSTYWLESWNVDGIQASFTARDIFDKLTLTTYKKGVMDKQNHTLYDLIQDVLADAGVSDQWAEEYGFHLDSTYLPLPYRSHAENLQILSNLAKSSLEQSPSGGIIFRYRDRVSQDQMKTYLREAPQKVYSFYYGKDNVPGGVLEESSPVDYASWEENFFALDGGMYFLPKPSEGNYLNVGYVSDVLPEEDGKYPTLTFDTAPAIQLDFTRNITFGTLELDFGDYYAVGKEIFIRGYRNVTSSPGYVSISPVFQKTVTGTWKDGKLYLNENFDRIVRLDVIVMNCAYQQLGRINRARVIWPMAFELTSEDIFDTEKAELLPACKDVIYNTYWNKYWVTPLLPDADPLMTLTVIPGVVNEVKHNDVYYDCEFRCDDPSITIEEQTHYAFVSYVKISGSNENVELKLFGNTYASESTVPVVSSVSPTGDDLEVDNPIAQSSDQRGKIADWIANYVSNREKYTVECLGYPELDPGDMIVFSGKEVVVLQADITINNGAMREKLVLRGDTPYVLDNTENGLGN